LFFKGGRVVEYSDTPWGGGLPLLNIKTASIIL
jgi:hypothetical protein